MSLSTYRIGDYHLSPCDPDLIDSRGILWVWEEPNPHGHYTISCDPTVGIPGWNRYGKTKDDTNDNCAIEVFRHYNQPDGTTRDVQVAEFAGPIDAIDAAPILNFLGKLYHGAAEEGEALVCIEVHPGPGLVTQRELVQRYGYSNIPPWRHHEGFAQKITKDYGWWSTPATRKVLWMKGMYHFKRDYVRIQSPWLVEEMADCVYDDFIATTARARHGFKDDRVVATLINVWYSNEWSLAIEPSENAPLTITNAPDYQATDMSASRMWESADERFSQLIDGGE